VILSGDRVTLEDLPDPGKLGAGGGLARTENELPATVDDSGARLSLRAYREKAEQSYMIRTLEECEWNISRAAVQLGVERTNLHKKMRGYGIKRGG